MRGVARSHDRTAPMVGRSDKWTGTVPESLKEKILKRFHDSPYVGHLGVKKATARIQRRFKWHKMAKEIKEYVRRFEICAKRKAIGANKAPLNPIPPPNDVWQTMTIMDIMDR